jgi:hypothetical protein
MGLREAMQQKQRWARAAVTARHVGVDVGAIDVKASDFKVVKPMHAYTFNTK